MATWKSHSVVLPRLWCIWMPCSVFFRCLSSHPTASTMVRHSKLQKQVLSLYRQFLRAGQDKPGFLPRIREEFRTNAAIQKTDVMHIEYLCRRAQRQLEQLRDVNTKQLGFFSNTKEDSWLMQSIFIYTDLWSWWTDRIFFQVPVSLQRNNDQSYKWKLCRCRYTVYTKWPSLSCKHNLINSNSLV